MGEVSESIRSLARLLALAPCACGASVVEPAGSGGGGGSGGLAGMGSASVAGGIGGASIAGSMGGGAGSSGGGAPGVEAWPAVCFPAMFEPAAEGAFVGPAGVSSRGEPALAGEAMQVRLNGFTRTFTRFEVAQHTVSGYAFDGGITLALPRSELGRYSCPEATIIYSNQSAGPREFNVMKAEQCCTIEITRVGALGEPIEGTFSGVLQNAGLFRWAIAEDGAFSVVNRASPSGAAGANSGF